MVSYTLAVKKDRAILLTELSLVLAAVFWGGNYAATKFAAETIPPLALVAFRFTAGGLLLFLILRLFEPQSRLKRADLLPMVGLGCFGVGISQVTFTFGVSLTTAANTGLIFASAPVWGLLLGYAFGFEQPSRRGLLGVALSVLGLGLIFYEGLGAGDASLLGDLLVLSSAVGVGAFTVFSMPMLERHSPLAVATYPMLFAAPLALLASSPYLLTLDWGGVGAGPWAAVAYAAVFATAYAFAAWQNGISRIGANRVLVYQYLITLTGVASGIVFFGEALGLERVVGGVIVLVGVYLARR
jgi:drug/metabolite transporter (DMT)-like permease